MDDKRARQIHLLWRDLGSCMAPMAYNELAGMMSKALEQLQMFKSKVSMPAGGVEPGCELLCRMLPANPCVARPGA
jgi:hypothetical protein